MTLVSSLKVIGGLIDFLLFIPIFFWLKKIIVIYLKKKWDPF